MNVLERFDSHAVLHELSHFLPEQAPLKDFIHHNTLHPLQNYEFFEALHRARDVFGYGTQLSIKEYRKHFAEGRISSEILEKVIATEKGAENTEFWKNALLNSNYNFVKHPRIGRLRNVWRNRLGVDMDTLVHPRLFRIVGGFLDQGVSNWTFPLGNLPMMESIKLLEAQSEISLFKGKLAPKYLTTGEISLDILLDKVVGQVDYYEQYLWDQQFAHPGWSGMVVSAQSVPQNWLKPRSVSLEELIQLELLLEIDTLEQKYGANFQAISAYVHEEPLPVLEVDQAGEVDEVMRLWQLSFEWEYYNHVLSAIADSMQVSKEPQTLAFQAMFCIDDRECSVRRHLEHIQPNCQTFGTPGFFGIDAYYLPENGQFYTKHCPAPMSPKYLIKETERKNAAKQSVHFHRHTHSLILGWLSAQTVGLLSIFKLYRQVFKPSIDAASFTSLTYMDPASKLSVRHEGEQYNQLQVGYTVSEMADRVEGLLKSIGLVQQFAPIIYVVGHGSSSVNNPHASAYDCGACSGRPGSVNARVISQMANMPEVRALLRERGIHIPEITQFVGALHDTTRDEVLFYDVHELSSDNQLNHLIYEKQFNEALTQNSVERAEKFELIDSKKSKEKIHNEVRSRSVSLFEPRPELNHATNALCIVGSRKLTRSAFLDRRAFLNSYDYSIDPKGDLLYGILKAAAPVCGGINLEYYFSRVDNSNFGAGSKLPHNVMGLIGVANGVDGDLRTGLPVQMIEIHDPVRLLFVVEQYPERLLSVIQRDDATYNWFKEQWVHLVCVHPETQEYYQFNKGAFVPVMYR